MLVAKPDYSEAKIVLAMVHRNNLAHSINMLKLHQGRIASSRKILSEQQAHALS